MKRFIFLFGVSVCSFAHAQQPPALPPAPGVVTQPGISVLRPEYEPPGTPPGAPTVAVAPNELRDLIRAQSEAIRVLSGKVDSLDDRLRRIESKLR
jgi:hypothetical protein